MVSDPKQDPRAGREPAPGATIHATYVTREVTFLAVSLFELESVSSSNSREAIYIVVSSSLLTFAATVWGTVALMKDELSFTGKLLTWGVTPLIAVVGCIYAILARMEFRTRSSLLDAIKSEQRNL